MELTPSAHVDTFARDRLPAPELWPTLEFSNNLPQHPARLNAATAILDVSVERYGPDRPALRAPGGEVWTYGELRDRVDRLAHHLVDHLGLVAGNRVLLRSPNNPWLVAAWLAVVKAGGIAVTTMPALRERDLTPIVERTEPAIALVDHRFAKDVVAVRDAVLPAMRVATYGAADSPDLTSIMQGGPRVPFVAVDTAADDVALLAPTSGSTGSPKITMHFHRDLLSIDDTFGQSVLGLGADDLVASTAPLGFTFGLGMLVIFALRAGACAFVTESVPPVTLADLVVDHSVTVLATAPTAYRQILRGGRAEKLRGLRIAVSAGEHLPATTREQLREKAGLEVVDWIGGTLLLHIFISAAGDDIRPGATGKPLPGYRATILDRNGHELGPGVEGRLAVIGPVGCRYLDDERQTTYVVNGWNVTGDTFVRDEDGYFFYRARTDDMIVSSGYNIGGPEVEASLETHPDVVEAGVVGMPDPDRGSIVCAFVVLRKGVPEDDETVGDLQAHVKRSLAPYKYPRRVRFVAALPRNASGKVQHFRLRAMAETVDV